MNRMNLSDNIVRLRHEKQITQEELAEFVGVTKASVSKWEMGKNLPDLNVLPVLATYFDVSIDELVGYEPLLTPNQIYLLYKELSADFAKAPLEQVMDKVKKLVKQYYSCYPFLEKICQLLANHYMRALTVEKQTEVLQYAKDLSRHILDCCEDVEICEDMVVFSAMFDLLMGNPAAAVEALEKISNPLRLASQSHGLLSAAYEMAGEHEKSYMYTQVCLYDGLMNFVENSRRYLALCMGDPQKAEMIIERTEKLIGIYELKGLHPNIMANFYYQEGLFFAAQEQKERALESLDRFAECIEKLFGAEEIRLTGDSYFDKMDGWFSEHKMETVIPRDRNVVLEDVYRMLDIPAFDGYKKDKRFLEIRKRLMEVK